MTQPTPIPEAMIEAAQRAYGEHAYAVEALSDVTYQWDCMCGSKGTGFYQEVVDAARRHEWQAVLAAALATCEVSMSERLHVIRQCPTEWRGHDEHGWHRCLLDQHCYRDPHRCECGTELRALLLPCTPTTSADPHDPFDGQALLDWLTAANLVSSRGGGMVRTSRADREAASRAFDVAEAFFSPLLSALYGDIATLHGAGIYAADEVERLRKLVRNVELYGTAFVWRDSGSGVERVLHPADVTVVIAADQLTELERLRAVYLAAQAVVDAARCAGLGSVGVALVAAVEAVTHPGGET